MEIETGDTLLVLGDNTEIAQFEKVCLGGSS
jgi:hypothetical protein